jgi:hypothetical protein
MSRLLKGLLLTLVHVALVLTVAAKYYGDRVSLPRAWALAAPYDPNLPIRGRYVRLQLRVEPRGAPLPQPGRATLSAEDGKLVAAFGPEGVPVTRVAEGRIALSEPVAFFIPEHVADPSRRPPGEALWVEVSVPKEGPPRPVRLGVKKDGVLTPLPLR